MKEWNSPELKELSLKETEKTLRNGNKLDYASYDATNGEITKLYFASGETPAYVEVPDADLKPLG